MNPYLEHRFLWPDFHDSYILAIREVLNPQLMPRYVVRAQQHLYVADPVSDRAKGIGKPDLNVRPGIDGHGTPAGGTAVATAPMTRTVPHVVESWTAAYLEIRSSEGDPVVTVIEVLSPANKYAGEDRDKYLMKRMAIFNSGTNLVEIDLLRGGPRLPFGDPHPPCAYSVMVSRAWDRPEVGFWPILLRDRLPTVPVPVRQDEPEPLVDLQAILHKVFDSGGYYVDAYRQPLAPALSPEDAAWAEALIAPAARPPTDSSTTG
jgi:hypothetical protein